MDFLRTICLSSVLSRGIEPWREVHYCRRVVLGSMISHDPLPPTATSTTAVSLIPRSFVFKSDGKFLHLYALTGEAHKHALCRIYRLPTMPDRPPSDDVEAGNFLCNT